ncbi:acyl-carrier-protein phosphodiesterase PptH-like [Montipora foliosa]|uniref:acyl-carrier-protein phosphodiesterase PptH-like n=1 Tax=Montipora foliosa TaxID=591990 RepID=UPI0035F1CEF8
MLLRDKRWLSSLTSKMSRIFAISDIHVDVQENLCLVESWSASDYKNDVLIVAGDVTDNTSLLKTVLKSLAEKFCKVCYVPGNHELWIRQPEGVSSYDDSIAKFHAIRALCDSIGVHTRPIKVQCCNHKAAWIVPIFSWYAKPEDDMENSLYVARDTENAELSNKIWMDNHLCVWPALEETVAQYFANLNDEFLYRTYDAPVISFSHFLPREELIPASEQDIQRLEQERRRLHLPVLDNPKAQGSHIQFNFTRFAGCKSIERQIRRLRSTVHVYGHQHRNRDRVIDDVRYVSFCLGYPKERSKGLIWGFSEGFTPRQIWP